MSQPPGFVDSAHPHHVCRLHCSLYGLKQAPQAWFHHLYTFSLQLGFVASRTDPSLFILQKGTRTTYILIYVDDILLTGTTYQIIDRSLSWFSIKDLGGLHFFLGIEGVHHNKSLLLSQSHYIRDLLQKFGMSDCKLVLTPIAPSSKRNDSGGVFMPDLTKYRSIVGALQYVTLTCPDVSSTECVSICTPLLWIIGF